MQSDDTSLARCSDLPGDAAGRNSQIQPWSVPGDKSYDNKKSTHAARSQHVVSSSAATALPSTHQVPTRHSFWWQPSNPTPLSKHTNTLTNTLTTTSAKRRTDGARETRASLPLEEGCIPMLASHHQTDIHPDPPSPLFGGGMGGQLAGNARVASQGHPPRAHWRPH